VLSIGLNQLLPRNKFESVPVILHFLLGLTRSLCVVDLFLSLSEESRLKLSPPCSLKYICVSSLQLSNQEADCRMFGTNDVPDLDFTVRSTIMTLRREELVGRNATFDTDVPGTRLSK
jgi:hypothetical protein